MSEERRLPDLHLELTSKCTLACPACPRTYHKGKYAVTEVPIEVIENIVNSGKRFEMVTMCGDHGDPIYHTRFHDVLRLLLKLPGEPFLSVATNGSYRSREWWKETARILRKKDEVIFGVDGLEDTSHIYRRNNDWKSIIEGMRVLKEFGECRITWQWILFSFNQHQMEEAARLSRDLKVDRFMIVGSSRHEEVDPWRPTISISEAQERFMNAYDLSAM